MLVSPEPDQFFLKWIIKCMIVWACWSRKNSTILEDRLFVDHDMYPFVMIFIILIKHIYYNVQTNTNVFEFILQLNQ